MAVSTAFSVASGSPALAFTVRGDASRLASRNAFRTTSIVQFAPLSSMKRSNRVVATRATLSEDSKALGRDVIVGVLAAGAALGLSVCVAEGSFANPIDVAKSKVTTSIKSAQDGSPSLPSAPSPGGAVGEAQKAAENVASGIKGQFDGIFAKGKPESLSESDKSVASNTGGTGSAFGDAQKRFSEFGKNPIADNIEEASKNTENTIASAKSPKPYAQRVEEAASKLQDLNSGAQSKLEQAKGDVGSVLPQ